MKQNKGLDMSSIEKGMLRSFYTETRHNLIISMNILLYLCRKSFLKFNPVSRGRQFQWNMDLVNDVIDNFIPAYSDELFIKKKKVKEETERLGSLTEDEQILMKNGVEGSVMMTRCIFILKEFLDLTQPINNLVMHPKHIPEVSVDIIKARRNEIDLLKSRGQRETPTSKYTMSVKQMKSCQTPEV